ncbi:MAG TPA: CocE/NonD family hydrolase [Mycobacteriales bacterium]|nr:CocE/NonD family hydrolase [Mycobacteriales bacterium]
MNRFRLVLSGACALLVFAGSLAASDAAPSRSGATGRPTVTTGPPRDYPKISGLSTARFATVKESMMVKMPDGPSLYVEVTRPKAAGRFGVILELSPYHGGAGSREGTRILPEPVDADENKIGLTGYFAPRGYAVVMVDLRGTGKSQGCLDHMGPKDQRDAKAIVEWAAKQPWSNGRVGMTGHSYVGSTPQMAAAQNPKGLVTIVPSAGLGAMYHHEFQNGVPYSLQWAGPLVAYEQIAIDRHLPGGDNFGRDMQYFGCGMTQSAAVTGEAYFSGAEVAWHKERDFRKGAAASKIPMFAVHGVNDNAARIAALDWFHARGGRAGDKAWIGQWDHGSGCCPTTREHHWTFALHAWFDKQLLQRKVDTGPPVEVFLNDGRVFTPTSWPATPSRALTLHANSGTLGELADESGSVRFRANPAGGEFSPDSAVFTTKALPKQMLIAGIPTMKLVTAVFGERIHINATLYDVAPDGERDRISMSGWAIQPELRNGNDKPSPVVPGQKMTIPLVSQAVAHVLAKGHTLELRIQSTHPDKVPTFAAGAIIDIFTGEGGTEFTIPVHDGVRLYADPLPDAVIVR